MTTCPRCATPREGSYRICPSCGFDYWADAAITTCPRCKTPRAGILPICPNCGYDYRTPQPAAAARLDAWPSDRQSPAGHSPAPLSPRQQYAKAVREQQSYGLLNFLFVGGGLVAGFVVGAYVGSALGGSAPLWFAWFIGPAIGGFAGFRLALSLWASRG